jgi:inositol-phosphate phosphatase / L-galactose 1-phosphate phosphatase / histidinol-phosphatase
MKSLEEHLQFTHCVLDETGIVACHYFNQPINAELKADASPVTIADVEIEAHIRRRIAETYPLHGILGEEQSAVNPLAAFCWVVDPIDGTKSFISGVPLWGTLLALLEDSQPIFGIVDVPALGERFVGMQGCRTVRNGQVIRASDCDELASCIMSATSPDMFSAEEAKIFDSLSRKVRFRRFGGDCYNYAMLASGRVDAVIEAGLKPYDFLPIVPIVNGAGGIMTDWSGNRLTPESDGRIIAAATPALHQAILAETTMLR